MLVLFILAQYIMGIRTLNMDHQQEIVTSLDFNWEDPYRTFDGNLLNKLILSAISFILMTTGTAFLLATIAFERNGADPRKRGILNQVHSILSMICL